MTTVTVSLVLLVSLAALVTFNSELTAGYTLQKGETVFGIVERHEETVEAILAVDLDVPDARSTIPTEKILISDPSHNINTLQGCREVYTIQPGDTPFDIARRYGVTVQGILHVNPNDPELDVYIPGLKINIPPCTGDLDSLKACADVYTVQPGDSLYKIAQQYGTTVQAILAANPDITNPDLIFPGQQINIPPCNGDLGNLKACADVYTVQPGDSLYKIAQQYGTTVQAILAANPDITNPDLIFPGQQINIPPCNGDNEIKWVV